MNIIIDDQVFGNLTEERAKAALICFGISIILFYEKEQMVPKRAARIRQWPRSDQTSQEER